MNRSLHLEFAVFNQALDFFAQFRLDAVAHFDDLFDFVTPHFLDIARIQKSYIDIAFGQLVAQHVFDLRELKFCIANQRDFFVPDLDAGRGAFEIKARDNFFGGVFDTIFYVYQFGFADCVKRGHSVRAPYRTILPC